MICNKQFLFSPLLNCVVVLVTQSHITGANLHGCVGHPVSPRWDSTLCSFGALPVCCVRLTFLFWKLCTRHTVPISAQRCCKPVPDTLSVRHEVLPGQLPAKEIASIIAHAAHGDVRCSTLAWHVEPDRDVWQTRPPCIL